MQAAKIAEMSKKKDGVGDMVTGLVDKIAGMAEGMVKSLTGGSSSEKSETDIEKEITNKLSAELENEIKNTNINENDVYNELNASIENEFKTMTKDSCLGSAEATNILEDMKAIGMAGSETNILQQADASTIAKCLNTKKIGNSAINGLSNSSDFSAFFAARGKSAAEGGLKQTKEEIKEEDEGDAIMDGITDLGKTGMKELGGTARKGIGELGDTTRKGIGELGGVAKMGLGVFLLPVIIIGVIIVAVIGIKLAKSAGGDSNQGRYYDDYEDYGDEEYYGGSSGINFSEYFDVPLAKRGLTLIVVFVILDLILKKTVGEKKK